MANASGIAKQIRYKVESTYGTLPGASGGQLLRRVESTISLSKDTYKSNEIRPDYQISDFRHGARKVDGTIKGELSPKTYSDFIAAALRRDFAAVTAITGASITIAAGSIVGGVQQYTVTRGAGSFLTDGVKAGDVVRLSAGSFNASNISKNLFVVSLTATVLTVQTLNGSAMVAEGPIASSTVTVTGKKTYTPTSGHTNKSFTLEHWFSDVAQSEQFTGCRVSSIDFALPPTGMATVDVAIMGQNVTTSTSAYFSSPTAATTTGVTAAVNGILLVGDIPVAVCTGLSFKIDGGYSGEPVVGSNVIPDVFPGSVNVTGQFTAYFVDGTMRDYFLNETEIGLSTVLTADNTAAADFVGFTFPRIKVGSAGKSDGAKGIVQTFSFQALFNGSGGVGTQDEQSTLVVQDSQA